MNKKILTKSQRKFVAREKARIRRQFSDLEKREEEIKKICNRFASKAVNGEQQPTAREKAPVRKEKPVKTAKKSQAKPKTKTVAKGKKVSEK